MEETGAASVAFDAVLTGERVDLPVGKQRRDRRHVFVFSRALFVGETCFIILLCWPTKVDFISCK